MLIALALLGCENNPDSEAPPAPPEIALETSLGVILPSDDTWSWPGVAGVTNVDDDDEDGTVDLDDADVDGEDDLAAFTITAHGRVLHATFAPIRGLVAVTIGGVTLDADHPEADLPAAETIDGTAEFLDWNTDATLTLTDATLGDALTAHLVSAPLLLDHHLQRHVERAVMMRISEDVGGDWNNEAMVEDYREVFGDRLLTVSPQQYAYDVWLQDEIEFANLVAPDHEADVVFDTIRNRGLRRLAEQQLVAPNVARLEVGKGAATSQDYGGNIEISPPVTVDGVHYPYGRIYWGSVEGYAVNRFVREFFAEQRAQAPFTLDTSWLCVGHIDEVQTIVPDPSAPKGFRLWISDTDAGLALLDAMDPETPLPKYAGSTNYATVGDITGDTALRDLNHKTQADQLDPMLETLRAGLGLDDEDIVRVPSLFERVPGCAGGLASLMPGTTNLVVADDADGEPVVIIADPFLRADLDAPETDPLIAWVQGALDPSVRPVFVDDFEVYHLGIGEVHCGTQTEREPPPPDWWVRARHLLEVTP